MRYLAFLIVLATLAFAPAPLPSREKPLPVLPYPMQGNYLMSWGDSFDGKCVLTSNTTGWYMYYGIRYYFVWQFENHVFTMWERSESSDGKKLMMDRKLDKMIKYDFWLDENLCSNWYPHQVRLELKRRR